MENNRLNAYLDEIGHEQLLTPEQEKQLSARIKQGDERALNRMVEANLRFVVSMARRYQGHGMTQEDLVSEGNIGLIKAAKKFDATRGLRFVTYASVYVQKQMEKAIAKEEAGQRAQTYRNGDSRSVDAPLGSKNGMSLLSVLADKNTPLTDERVYNETLTTAIEKALDTLDERERNIIDAFFGIGRDHLTMAEIAVDMGLRRERVRQIRDKAVRRLKKNYRRFLEELRSSGGA